MMFVTNTPRVGETAEQTAARYNRQNNAYTSSEKPTNPKDAVGVKKATLSTVSGPFILAVGNAMLEGALKYGRHNYRTIGVRSSVYYDALMRHMLAWWEGQDTDPESGESHIVKAAACLAVLFDSMYRGNLNDDRPPRVEDGWVEEFNAKAKALVEKYPTPKPAHTQLELDLADAWEAGAEAAGEPKVHNHVEGESWDQYFDDHEDKVDGFAAYDLSSPAS